MVSCSGSRGKSDLVTSRIYDFERAYKLPKEHRYFNVSVLWIFYYPAVVRLLYRMRIRHEFVTLLSLAAGITAGIFILQPGYFPLLFGALFIHLKDVLDASDGSLARLRGQTNRIARFLDSLCDFVAITWIIAALGIRIYPLMGSSVIVIAFVAFVSVFVQCSYFNFYLVQYTKLFEKTNVRSDESITPEDRAVYSVKWKKFLLLSLQRVYGVVYGWQDRLIAWIDGTSFDISTGGGGDRGDREMSSRWYGDKKLMTLNSPLCFGTHLFVLILTAVLSHPEYFYYLVVFPGNAYLVYNIFYRHYKMKLPA